MLAGILAGLLWGLDTVILGVALLMSPFSKNEYVIFLAPFISTFIHDFFSSMWIFLYLGIKKQANNIIKALKTKSGRFIVLAALAGGPIGMTGYVLSIRSIGPAYTAIISAIYPAVGALLSYIFLKEKMRLYQIGALLVSIIAVILLSYTPGNYQVENGLFGFVFAFLAVFGWAFEAVIIAYGLRDDSISDETALQIRQFTAVVVYGLIILPLLKGWNATSSIFFTNTSAIILLATFFGTASYLFYYKSISQLGASKAMALNITYVAWSIIFGFLLFKELLTGPQLILTIVIIIGSIIAGSKNEK